MKRSIGREIEEGRGNRKYTRWKFKSQASVSEKGKVLGAGGGCVSWTSVRRRSQSQWRD